MQTLKAMTLLILLVSTAAWGSISPRCDEWTQAKLEYSVASSNLANLETTRTDEGGAYKKKIVKILPDGRCDIQSVNSFKTVYEPGHPDADVAGFVKYPDINTVEELNNLTHARDKLKLLKNTHPATSQNKINSDIDFD